jgi:hypothetical protein
MNSAAHRQKKGGRHPRTTAPISLYSSREGLGASVGGAMGSRESSLRAGPMRSAPARETVATGALLIFVSHWARELRPCIEPWLAGLGDAHATPAEMGSRPPCLTMPAPIGSPWIRTKVALDSDGGPDAQTSWPGTTAPTVISGRSAIRSRSIRHARATRQEGPASEQPLRNFPRSFPKQSQGDAVAGQRPAQPVGS